MKKITDLSTRQMIQQLRDQGISCSLIAEQLDLSLSVVKKWSTKTHRGEFGGPMGRPSVGALGSFDPEVVNRLYELRRDKSGWGPYFLRDELLRQGYEESELPARSSIARYLHAQGLTRAYQRHAGVDLPKLPPVEAPHDCWQMDAKGTHKAGSCGHIGLINLKDWVSRIHLIAYPAPVSGASGNCKTDDYQTALRACFVQYGLPKAIQADHESVFINNSQGSPFPTRIYLWLVALGIQLCFSRLHQPTDQAIVERSHQTIFQQALAGQTFDEWDQCMNELERRRKILNEQAPCASLGGIAPLQRDPQACIPRRPFDISRESEYLDLNRVYKVLATGTWRRKVSKQKTVSLADEVFYLKDASPLTMIDISFDPDRQQLCFRHDEGPEIGTKPLKGLTKEKLMGSPTQSLPKLQLSIPFNYTFQVKNYQLRLFEKNPVTT